VGWGELDVSSRLEVVEIARVPDMLPSLFPLPDRAQDLSAPGILLTKKPCSLFSCPQLKLVLY